MIILPTHTVGSIVAQNWKTASVFKKYNIDFCCNGHVMLKNACASAEINLEQVLDEIQSSLRETEQADTNFNEWPLDRLADYVTQRHHQYVTDKLPEIAAYLKKICLVHGHLHPELFEIQELFQQTSAELTVHMKKEEFMIFPLIKKMTRISEENQNSDFAPQGTIRNPIAVMMHDHADEGDRFNKIAALSNQYRAPEDGCTTYHLTYKELAQFEQNLHQHIHLENNILFPKALLLEKRLINSAS